jgi:uncharacterized SAM-binding protein YcdF (DUF218 family)
MDKHGPEDDGSQGDDRVTGRLGRLLGVASNILLLLMATLLMAVAGGYYLFIAEISQLDRPGNPKADAIIVLTGGYQRIEEAVNLLSSGAGKRLLISGVNRTTSMDQIRRFTGSSKDLFDCCVDVGYDALDTTGNAAEAVAWIKARGFSSVIVVTNNYHMPRSLLELRRIDGKTDYIAYPVEGTPLTLDYITAHPYFLVTLTSEYLKTLLTAARDWLPD